MSTPKRIRRVRAATLADVGRAAGVSAMAASAVLNRARTSSRISEETRRRILQAAERLAYRPNAAARALANRRMNTIGVATIVDRKNPNAYFFEVLNGIFAGAAEREQNTTVFTIRDWKTDGARIGSFCDGRIDGLILLAPIATRDEVSLPSHTPFVAIHANAPLPGVVNIESDEERGAFDMVRLLVAQGHRRIMHLAGPPGLIGSERRIRGYRRALAASGIPFDPGLLVTAGFSQESGHDTMRAWLRTHRGKVLPQAIFSANDQSAIGVMEALAEQGIRVPDDVSVCGFDDSIAARVAVPQLTTVRQPLHAMGLKAVELLLASIEQGKGTKESPVVFPVDLVPRASVSAPPTSDRVVPGMR